MCFDPPRDSFSEKPQCWVTGRQDSSPGRACSEDSSAGPPVTSLWPAQTLCSVIFKQTVIQFWGSHQRITVVWSVLPQRDSQIQNDPDSLAGLFGTNWQTKSQIYMEMPTARRAKIILKALLKDLVCWLSRLTIKQLESESGSTVSNSLQPHRLESMELSRPEYWSG